MIPPALASFLLDFGSKALPKVMELIEKHAPVVMAYLKGRQEQRQADKLKTLKSEARQSSKITERIEEIEREDMSKIGKQKKRGDTGIYREPDDRMRGPQPKW